MMIGPEPMSRILWMSSRRGTLLFLPLCDDRGPSTVGRLGVYKIASVYRAGAGLFKGPGTPEVEGARPDIRQPQPENGGRWRLDASSSPRAASRGNRSPSPGG